MINFEIVNNTDMDNSWDEMKWNEIWMNEMKYIIFLGKKIFVQFQGQTFMLLSTIACNMFYFPIALAVRLYWESLPNL